MHIATNFAGRPILSNAMLVGIAQWIAPINMDCHRHGRSSQLHEGAGEGAIASSKVWIRSRQNFVK